MTKRYIGTKIIMAWPEERNGAPGYAVKYHDGYTSWSPAAIFEDAYRAIEGDSHRLNFGDAIEMLKRGNRVARAGWNGKGMYLWMNQGIVDASQPGFAAAGWPQYGNQMTLDGVRLAMFEPGPAGITTRMPNINMRTASGATVTGWLASQTDMLAEDWVVVGELRNV